MRNKRPSTQLRLELDTYYTFSGYYPSQLPPGKVLEIWRGLDDGPVPQPANDNRAKGARGHEHPAMDQAESGELMETPTLNRFAVGVFLHVRRLLDDASPSPWLAQNDGGAHGVDSVRDMGKPVETILREWTAGPPANDNDPLAVTAMRWSRRDGEHNQLAPGEVGVSANPAYRPGRVTIWTKPAVPERTGQTINGEPVVFPAEPETRHVRQVGNLYFTRFGALRQPPDEVTQAKGADRAAQLRAADVDAKRYSGAAIPINKKTGEALVEFVGAVPGSIPAGTDSDDAPPDTHHRPASSFAPMAVLVAAEKAREAAEDTLAALRVKLGAECHEALCDAASGVAFWLIGNGRDKHDKRAARRGLDLVRQAVLRLVPKSRSQNH